MEYIVIWLFFCVLVGWFSDSKVLGFWGGFFISLLLSPLIGLIFAIVSKDRSVKDYEIRMQQQQQQQLYEQQQQLYFHNEQLKKQNQQPPIYQESISDQLIKWKKQKDDGIITEEEFQKIKSKLLAEFEKYTPPGN
jgi:uncharacterized membrane protein